MNGFVQPFIDYLLERGHTVTLVSSKEEIIYPVDFSEFPKAPVSEKFHKILINFPNGNCTQPLAKLGAGLIRMKFFYPNTDIAS